VDTPPIKHGNSKFVNTLFSNSHLPQGCIKRATPGDPVPERRL
jgi:hypothetical protein